MRAKTLHLVYGAKRSLPYLWGFAAAAALDYVVDVQTMFLSVLAVAAAISATSLILRRIER